MTKGFIFVLISPKITLLAETEVGQTDNSKTLFIHTVEYYMGMNE